jgi:integrase/recombinase XerD
MHDEVEEFLSHLAVEKGLSKNTLAAYKSDLESYFNINAKIELNEESLNSFISSERSAGKAEASIAREIVTLRNFASFVAREKGGLNAIAKFSPPKIGKRLPKALPISTIEQLLDIYNSATNPRELRDRAIMEMLYGTGMRISELTKLNIEDLKDLESNQAIRVFGKGSKERVLPIGGPAIKSLQDYLVRGRPNLLKRGTQSALFLNSRGSRISRQIVWQTIQGAATAAGISEHISPHTLRHSFATHLIDGGADIRVVQELLGHASVTTTQIYTLVTIDKLRESYSAAHPRAK